MTHPGSSRHSAFYGEWLARGAHGEMAWLARPEAVARRADLRGTLPTVRSVLVVAHEYFLEDPPEAAGDPSRGVIARYARGRDYHKVVKRKLHRLLDWLSGELGRSVEGRAYVDTGPILERELASRAGLGWFGRNTMLIHPRRGSWFFLGCLLLDLELEADPPFVEDHCGTCNRCVDACPTGALLGRDAHGAPVIDARRCISYLTIEHQGPIPRELRPLMGNRVFGCDICQEVCPFNARFAEPATEPAYAARGPGEPPRGVEARQKEGVSAETRRSRRTDRLKDVVPAWTSRSATPIHPGTEAPALVELLETALDEKTWDAFSRGSAIRRAGRQGFARNVCVAIGNWLADRAEVPDDVMDVLRRALVDPEPLVRGHAAWALGRVVSPDAARALSTALETDDCPAVREEVEAAL